MEFQSERDLKTAFKEADGMKIDGRRIVVDVERGRTVKGWKPRRLGGGLGSTRVGKPEQNQRYAGRDVQGRDSLPPAMADAFGGPRGGDYGPPGYGPPRDYGFRGGYPPPRGGPPPGPGYYRDRGPPPRDFRDYGPPPSRYPPPMNGYGYPGGRDEYRDRDRERPAVVVSERGDRSPPEPGAIDERRRSRSPRRRSKSRDRERRGSRDRERRGSRDRRRSRSRDRR